MPKHSPDKSQGPAALDDSGSHLRLPGSIGFIGLGLIGGTLAKTIHRFYPNIRLVACEPDRNSLMDALAEGVIAQGYPSLTEDSPFGPDHDGPRASLQSEGSAPLEAFSKCRYIFLCAPVQKNKEFLKLLAPILSESCILTDTGSVKSSIHQEVAKNGLSACFIGGHPMAGSEKSGYGNATAYLFENAYFIITPNSAMAPALVEEYRRFIASLGLIPLLMDPTQHDYATAAVSHLPHILASSLVNLVRSLDNEEESMKSIAAGGFKDITRIASSSPKMWQEICDANREQILKLLSLFMDSLAGIKEEISECEEEKILYFFQEAKDYRDSLPLKGSGPLPSVFEIYCDLIDEAGGIATIATILATNGISIKNIGIIHNREFEDGVLRIEFYDEASLSQAILLLRRHHYTIYER